MNKEELVKIMNKARSKLEERRLKNEQDIRLKVANLIENKEFNELITSNAFHQASKGKSDCMIRIKVGNQFCSYDKDIHNIIQDKYWHVYISLLKSGLENKYADIIFTIILFHNCMDIKLVWDP